MSHEASFFRESKNFNWSSLEIFLPLCSRAWCANKLHNGLSKKYLVLNIFIIMIDFCLFGNIPHDFLVPRIIESAPKTFMSIQIPDLHRVGVLLTKDSYRIIPVAVLVLTHRVPLICLVKKNQNLNLRGKSSD